MATYRYLSSTSGFMPVATQYVIGYVRKPDEFPVNRIVQLVPAPAPTFFYYKLDRDQSIRLRQIKDHLWADGSDRPIGRDNQFGFTQVQAFTVRYDYNSRVGNQALELAQKQWAAKQVYLQGLASQAMLGRTYNVVTLLDTVGNWPSTNTADANSLNGGAGPWDQASDDPQDGAYNAIKKTVMTAVNRIFLQTNGKVKWSDLRMLLNPEDAIKMSNTAEIHNYLKYSIAAEKQLAGDEANYNERFGLPKRLYGIEIVVEDTPIVTDLPTAGATTTTASNRAFVKAAGKAAIISRPGGLDSQVGPSFSTCQVYWYKHQMEVTEFVEPKHQYTDMHVTDQHVALLPAPESGFLITGITQ